MRDIAAKLNISPATVHRALTDKSNVNDKTRQIIRQTASDMGYHFGTLEDPDSEKEVRIALMLRNAFPEQTAKILEGLKMAEKELRDHHVKCDGILLDPDNYVNALNGALEKTSAENYDGVIFYFANTKTQLNDEVRNKFRKNHTLMASLYSDDGFGKNDIEFMVTPDAITSGGMAADLLRIKGLGEGSKVAAFVGRRDFKCHLEYMEGFTERCSEYGIEIVDIIEHRDNDKIAYFAAQQFLNDWPTIDGIYCSTAITAPICKAVEEAGLHNRICLIGTGIMSGTDEYLRSGTANAIIYYDPRELGHQAALRMYDKISGRAPVDRLIALRPQIITKSNIMYFS